ncbi:DUF4062 domain-containing protein [Janthinobacterium sp. 1_2014MBL_MicDiv]|uniref:DUF4062 domain-containing protein n=1 Tax=Janthinobacterium sp. 1_2014MBL_MicDiv TaxID=1644131 RepID=UPI000A6E78EF|nr:DUF4062 domain-containing protein [Janthinobacterium sp. 1_2014MBL_MicDiv]
MQALMEMDCIPAGMELFPAMDDEQFNFIKRVIDDSDYYLLIIGGRYGSLTSEGISYTEKEFDYAVEKGLKVVAFIHDSPEDIPSGKVDRDNELTKKLADFRNKVKAVRLVKSWNSVDQLPGLVALSLAKTIRTYPAVGWIRGSEAVSSTILAEMNELRKENAELRGRIDFLESDQESEKPMGKIAGLDHVYTFNCLGFKTIGDDPEYISVTKSFEDIFLNLSLFLEREPKETDVRKRITDFFRKDIDLSFGLLQFFQIDESDFQVLKSQFRALKLIEVYFSDSEGDAIWVLTEEGISTVISSRAVKIPV